MEIEASKPSGIVEGIAVDGTVVGGLSPLSEALWRDRTSTEFVGDVSARLTWKDLTVMVTLGSGETQNVLEGLTGYAEPGTLTALMGPSGSGKSTLLDALSSRLAANAFLSGTVLLNGRKTKLSFGTAAYVTQDDNLLGTLTVRETISYSARLRLPDKMPWSEKRALVESTIIEMGLQDCADTVIGNWHLRGISGGEKRRVSIALEILMRPRLLFLDEPTSGLDRCINSDFDKVKATLKGSMKLRFEASDDPIEKITTAEAIRSLTAYYRTSQYCYAAREKVEEISKVKGEVLESGGSRASFLMQAFTLTKRSLINMSRDFGYYWLRLVIYIVVTVCIGTIYLNVGTGYNSILARGSCASFVFGFVTFHVNWWVSFLCRRDEGIFMLVSGYFRLPNDIPKPVWRYPMSYISFHFWALQGQYQNDLKGLLFDNQSPDLPKIPGEYILENIFQIDVHRSKWGRSQRHIQYDCHLPRHLLYHDQDQ
ncbi:hypothetical protein D5086_032619 [Populus alba]|uniref:Uncharacterized protein n=1 Tax=Populus alba TaxID=43335 RepID=A0ACC4ALV4_POPAL